MRPRDRRSRGKLASEPCHEIASSATLVPKRYLLFATDVLFALYSAILSCSCDDAPVENTLTALLMMPQLKIL